MCHIVFYQRWMQLGTAPCNDVITFLSTWMGKNSQNMVRVLNEM